MSITHTTCKQTARSLRIWIEGDKLSAAGFPPDTPYSTCYDVQRQQIRLDFEPTSKKRVTKSTRNDKPRPIIDLSNKSVGTVFEAGDALQVRFSTNRIIIERA